MKRSIWHIICGAVIVLGSSSGIMATEIEANSTYSVEAAKEEATSEETTATDDEKELSLGEEVVNYAIQFIGTPYVSGGNDLNNGVDCSGFTKQVYKHFDVELSRSSSAQYANNGYEVSESELLPGDLVFYGYGSVCHVAIYIGDEQVVHAPVPGQSVCIVPVWQRGDAPIIGYKRIFDN